MWKKIEKPSNMWDFEEKAVLGGVYISVVSNKGPNSSCIHSVKNKQGEEVSFWGSTVLDDKLQEVAANYGLGKAVVRITYLGMTKSQRGTNYKDFEVEVWDQDGEKVEEPDYDSAPDLYA